jgi:hypothetical protein
MSTERFEMVRKIRLSQSDLKDIVKSEKESYGEYPWEECIADQVARYGDEETAKKVCGAIKAGMQKSFQEGDDLENACWPGYEAIGLKEGPDGRMVPNCVPVKEK